MRYAIVESTAVVNVALADEPLGGNWVLAPDHVGPGWAYDGADWSPPPVPLPEVPQQVTMRQARLALLGAGLLGAVETAIDGLDEPQRSAARIEWDYSSAVQRHNGFVEQLAPALGLTEPQLDALFITASGL